MTGNVFSSPEEKRQGCSNGIRSQNKVAISRKIYRVRRFQDEACYRTWPSSPLPCFISYAVKS
jgi:hypothetical protein